LTNSFSVLPYSICARIMHLISELATIVLHCYWYKLPSG